MFSATAALELASIRSHPEHASRLTPTSLVLHAPPSALPSGTASSLTAHASLSALLAPSAPLSGDLSIDLWDYREQLPWYLSTDLGRPHSSDAELGLEERTELLVDKEKSIPGCGASMCNGMGAFGMERAWYGRTKECTGPVAVGDEARSLVWGFMTKGLLRYAKGLVVGLVGSRESPGRILNQIFKSGQTSISSQH